LVPNVIPQQEYFIHLFTHGVLYIKSMLVKLNHWLIPRLSRTLNFNFQDFPGANSFSRTFQVLEILGKNPALCKTFQKAWEPWKEEKFHSDYWQISWQNR